MTRPDRASDGRRQRIAIIGSGIAGLGAAHALATNHHVTVYEAEPRLGGHARTLWAGQRSDQPVDTGFIVFNHANYPRLTALFDELDIQTTPADMSFSVSLDNGAFEFALRKDRALRGIFGQPSNILSPRFLGLLRDILRFNAQAKAAARDPSLTLGALIENLGLGDWFRDRFLVPFTAAIWSAPPKDVLAFPAQTLIAFLDNHGLLTHHAHPQWYSVKGGSAVYVDALARAITARGGVFRTGHAVDAIRRADTGAHVTAAGQTEFFDAVVLAVHADQALGMLVDATGPERAALADITFQPNTVVLHSDPTLMPVRRACLAAWNHVGSAAAADAPVSVTYWMNALQVSIPKTDPLFVSLNPTRPVRDRLIFDQAVFHHPVYTHQSIAARDRIRATNGTNNTWFCGAWLGNGFHEDGLASAQSVADQLNGRCAPR